MVDGAAFPHRLGSRWETIALCWAPVGVGLKDNSPFGKTMPRFPVHFLCAGQCGGSGRSGVWGQKV